MGYADTIQLGMRKGGSQMGMSKQDFIGRETMSKHTPGPWKCNREGLITKDDRYGLHIAQVATVGMGYAIQPNAHLIAAAPAMYEALIDLLPHVQGDDFAVNAILKAQQALAQAEGKQ